MRVFDSEIEMMNLLCPQVMCNSNVQTRGDLTCAGRECIACVMYLEPIDGKEQFYCSMTQDGF